MQGNDEIPDVDLDTGFNLPKGLPSAEALQKIHQATQPREMVDILEEGTVDLSGNNTRSNLLTHPAVASQSRMVEDLMRSSLEPADMQARPLTSAERSAVFIPHTTDGYVIPYFNILGARLPYYRVRQFDHEPKYKQPRDTQNHIYFTPTFLEVLKRHCMARPQQKYVMIVEGEKKAACACKFGFPAVAVGGVDSWRNRNIILPETAELKRVTVGKEKMISAKIDAGDLDEGATTYALGFQELVEYCVQHHIAIIIAYDSDRAIGTKPQVQRAAAAMAFELRYKGIPFNSIKQLILPAGDKVKGSVDDFITAFGAGKFQELIDELYTKKSTFPRHPNIRDFISKKLQRSRLTRKEVQAISIAVLSDLDANGTRLKFREQDQLYYFSHQDRRLIRVDLNTLGVNQMHDTAFGQLLYRQFGLSANDNRLLTWMGAQYSGEDPIDEVTPHRILARNHVNDDSVCYQINDGQYIRVSGNGEEPLEILDNGSNGILFESGQVEAHDAAEVLEWFERLKAEDNTDYRKEGCWWIEVLRQVRLRDQDKKRLLTALLFYTSPWLYRWRGMQLPVELTIGESGSGKSTLYELRLSILNGDPRLRNAPTDLKDWHASVASSGALHVTDNVQLVERSLRQRLSDEICRLITEPTPHIEMRKLYTNADLIRFPVTCVFAITAIQQPFQNVDILQRSISIELDKGSGEVQYDGDWKTEQIRRFGGRSAWLAHHLYVLHKFFKLVKEKWDPKYKAKHRLIHLEQTLMLMAEVFGIDASWIPAHLSGLTDSALSEADWVFEGLTEFIHFIKLANIATPYHQIKAKPPKFTCQDISNWASGNADFMDNNILTNARRLGRYMQTHKNTIAHNLGVEPSGTLANRVQYVLKPEFIHRAQQAAKEAPNAN